VPLGRVGDAISVRERVGARVQLGGRHCTRRRVRGALAEHRRARAHVGWRAPGARRARGARARALSVARGWRRAARC
jgi:hypothetical protein